MHDWTLNKIQIDWVTGQLTLVLKNRESKECAITATGVIDVHVPRRNDWGESVSVNSITGPIRQTEKSCKLEIEMQSGDTLQIVAESFVLPLNKGDETNKSDRSI
jgi:hypothetical protein